MSPLSQRSGDMLLYHCPLGLCVLSHSFLPANSIVQAVKLGRLTQCRANVSPPSTTSSLALGQRLVFGATLNVCQRHRWRANINPALVQSIVPVPSACRYLQHEVLTRTEWILASNGDAGPTFKRHCVGVSL